MEQNIQGQKNGEMGRRAAAPDRPPRHPTTTDFCDLALKAAGFGDRCHVYFLHFVLNEHTLAASELVSTRQSFYDIESVTTSDNHTRDRF